MTPQPATRKGILFVVSAPSGAGKSTLVRRLLSELHGIEFSVSFTTRPRRSGEQDGREYHFVDDSRFDAMVAEGAFLEWAPVFERRYGTGRAAVEERLAAGVDVVLDIDVEGARQVRESNLETVSIFVLPPDFATLEARLRERGSDSREQVSGRLSRARREAEDFKRYDYLVINDDLDGAADDLRHIVEASRCRVDRRATEAERVLSTFPDLA